MTRETAIALQLAASAFACRVLLCFFAVALACVAARFLKERLRELRKAGIPALLCFAAWTVCMLVNGGYTDSESKERLNAMHRIEREVYMQDSSPAPAAAAGGTGEDAVSWREIPHWNKGVFEDGQRIAFDADWTFPHGTEHLASVEIVSCGEALPDGFSTNAIASLGARLSLYPGVSSFRYGRTPSNTYAFVWENARAGRIGGTPFDGRIELFRDGGTYVAANGEESFSPRTLPFPHDGFGQDDEWVRANFTNAEEILSMGYQHWVDAQVGTGLENGLYKFSVTVPETPPETVRLGVGDMSVAVTNAGEYVFLLWKGFEYALDASSPCATNFTYFATDDLGGPGNALRAASRSAPRIAPANYDSGEDVWTSDSGALSIVFPFGAIKWNPKIEMMPARWHPSRANSSHMFRPAVSDVPGFAGMSYRWSSSDESVCSVSGASERTATFSCHFPKADAEDFVLSLEMSFHCAFLSGAPVHATFTHRHQRLDLEADYEEEVYLEDIPPDSRGMMLFSAAPSVKFFERGRAEEMQHSTLGCWYVAEEYGTMELSMSGDEVEVTDGEWRPVSDGYRWNVRKGTTCARHFHVESMVPSSSPSGTVFTVTFTPVPSEGTNEISRTASVAFVEWETETVADWPADRSRKTIGVCEDVFLRFEPEMPNLVLSKSCPESKLAKKGDGSWLYRAPLDPVVDSIRESLCGGEIAAFEVVAPTGYDARRVEINRNQGVFGVAGSFQIKFYLTLLPTNVSFRALDIKEVGKYASPATGYFAEPRNKGFLFHSTADVWSEVLPKNRGTDYAQMAELDPPWNGGGTLRWPIPNVYRRRKTEEENQDGNEERFFCDTDQYFSVGSNGTSSISKFDWIVTCTTNRIFSVWRIDRQ